MSAKKKQKAPPPDGTSKAHLALENAPQYDEMVTTAESTVEAVKKGPNFQKDQAVQDAAGDVSTAAAKLKATRVSQEDAKKTLALLEPQLLQDAAALHRAKDGLESAITKATGGVRAKILEYNAQVAGRTPYVLSTDPPEQVQGTSVPGSLAPTFQCKGDRRAICFHYAWGTDPSNPDAWTGKAIEGLRRYTAPGPFTLGQKIYFRMAIQRRKTGLGAWSNVIEVIIR